MLVRLTALAPVVGGHPYCISLHQTSDISSRTYSGLSIRGQCAGHSFSFWAFAVRTAKCEPFCRIGKFAATCCLHDFASRSRWSAKNSAKLLLLKRPVRVRQCHEAKLASGTHMAIGSAVWPIDRCHNSDAWNVTRWISVENTVTLPSPALPPTLFHSCPPFFSSHLVASLFSHILAHTTGPTLLARKRTSLRQTCCHATSGWATSFASWYCKFRA